MRPEPGKGRVEAFSDGVFAIVVTIMVLELKLPDAFAAGIGGPALAAFAPKLIAYAMSFLVLAIMWVNHRHLLDGAPRVSSGLLWLNNLLLFGTTLIPAATEFVGAHPFAPVAGAIYGGALTLTAATFALMRARLTAETRSEEDLARVHRTQMLKSVLGASLYAASVALSFVSLWAAFACWIVVPAMFFLPERRVAR